MIKLTEIKKNYKKDGIVTEALKGISLEIQGGEMVAIMGKSGSGKSTLLHILGGLDKPDYGEYMCDGQKVSGMSVKELDMFRKKYISIILQNDMFLSDYNVYENVEIPLIVRQYNKTKRRDIVINILKKLDIYDIRKKRPQSISGGQRQRVAIARAICSNGDIIIADEPTGSIDFDNSKNVMNILKTLNMSGKTVIVVTHDNSVASYCDRIIKFKDGMVVNEE